MQREIRYSIQLDVPHTAGIHCSSTSLRDVLAYDGYHLSEALVFGLGSGLGFVLWPDPEQPPAFRFNGRARDLEGKFYVNLGAPLQWKRRWDPTEMALILQNGRPILAQTDIFALPYYDGVHFAGHGVVVIGLDLANEIAILADVIDDQPQIVPLEALRRAMGPNPSPLVEPYHWAPAPRLDLRLDAACIRRAIHRVAEEMLTPDHPEAVGIPAMRRYVEHLPNFHHAADWRWVARFAYQTIEKRGTGGGAFRVLYARFLEEASEWVPSLSSLAKEMAHLGRAWQTLAGIFKQTFIEGDLGGFSRAAEAMDRLIEQETALMERLANV